VVQPKQFSNLWKSAKENYSSLAAFPFLWEKGGEHSHWCSTASALPGKFNSAIQISFSSGTGPRSNFHLVTKAHGVYARCRKTDNKL